MGDGVNNPKYCGTCGQGLHEADYLENEYDPMTGEKTVYRVTLLQCPQLTKGYAINGHDIHVLGRIADNDV